jgi:hypothetical protein
MTKTSCPLCGHVETVDGITVDEFNSLPSNVRCCDHRGSDNVTAYKPKKRTKRKSINLRIGYDARMSKFRKRS